MLILTCLFGLLLAHPLCIQALVPVHKSPAPAGVYLNPDSGRFWTMDTFEGNQSAPLSLHKYLYCHANPVNGVDSTGHEFDSISMSVATGIAVGLQTMYDSTVVAAGFTIMNTLSAVAFGVTVDDMMPGFTTAITWDDELSFQCSVIGVGGEQIVTLKADIISLARFGVKVVPNVPKGGGGRVLVDSNEAINLDKDPTLGGRIKPGEKPLISYVSGPELRNKIEQNRRLGVEKGLKGLPKGFDNLEILTARADVDLAIDIRGQSTKTAGKFGDGIIGAQAIKNEIPLVTNDGELGRIVNRYKPGLARMR